MVSDVSVINCNHVLKPETIGIPDSLWFPPTVSSPHGYQFRVAEMDLNSSKTTQRVFISTFLLFSIHPVSDLFSPLSSSSSSGENVILRWSKKKQKKKGEETWGTSGICSVSEPESFYGH